MILNYLKIALRNLKRQKSYAFINILGLAIGLASFILIMLWVADEFSYENNYEKADNIYLLYKQYKMGNKQEVNRSTPYPFAASLREELPLALEATKYRPYRALVQKGELIVRENDICLVDAHFFKVFETGFIQGYPETALAKPYSCVITKDIAKKYFGEEDPMGQVLIFDNSDQYKITGIIENQPGNTHIDYNIYIPLADIAPHMSDTTSWYSHYLRTYILTPDDVLLDTLNSRLSSHIQNHMDAEQDLEIRAHPISKLHLYSVDGKNQGIQYVYIFTITGILILLIACINFTNIAISLSMKRAREIGLKKVVGAQRSQLIKQFLGEAFIQAFASLIIAMALVELLRPFFNDLTGKEILIPYLSRWFLPSLVGLLVIITLLAGSYPAFLLSSFKPVSAFRGNIVSGKGRMAFRKGLVIFQFVISIGLIITSILIFLQLKFISNKNLGFDRENIIYLSMEGDLPAKYDAFYNDLMAHPGIKNLARSLHIPGSVWSIMRGLDWEGKEDDESVAFGFESVDYNYIETVGLELVAGRDFSKEYGRDSVNVIFNEEAIKVMGYDDPIGKSFNIDSAGEGGKIIGIVKNFNALPLTHEIEPMLLAIIPDYYQRILIRLNPGDVQEAINHVEETWKKYVPDFPFDFDFLDKRLERQYNNELRIGKLALALTILAILITCIGLFGLAAPTAQQRTKEIGIRKVSRASTTAVIMLVGKSLARWVLVANIIAWPQAYYFVTDWLQNFASRIDIQ